MKSDRAEERRWQNRPRHGNPGPPRGSPRGKSERRNLSVVVSSKEMKGRYQQMNQQNQNQ